jgi:hypothetical protein
MSITAERGAREGAIDREARGSERVGGDGQCARCRGGQSREFGRSGEQADPRGTSQQPLAIEVRVEREVAQPSLRDGVHDEAADERVRRVRGEPAAEAAERVHARGEVHRIARARMQPERAAAVELHGGRLEVERVEPHEPVAEAHPRVADEDAHAGERRSR